MVERERCDLETDWIAGTRRQFRVVVFFQPRLDALEMLVGEFHAVVRVDVPQHCNRVLHERVVVDLADVCLGVRCAEAMPAAEAGLCDGEDGQEDVLERSGWGEAEERLECQAELDPGGEHLAEGAAEVDEASVGKLGVEGF